MNRLDFTAQAKIRVVGVGGAGNNMVSWLHKKGIRGAEIIATNSDQQHLNITSQGNGADAVVGITIFLSD